MNLSRVYMFLAVWTALTTTAVTNAEIVIGGDAGGDIGMVDPGSDGDLGGSDGGECPDIEEVPGTGSIYDSYETPPMTGGGMIDLLGPHDRRPIACFAQNGRGEVFEAMGTRAAILQERAMRKCEAVSRRCRPLGCHRLM